jgi:hypothetical protein
MPRAPSTHLGQEADREEEQEVVHGADGLRLKLDDGLAVFSDGDR